MEILYGKTSKRTLISVTIIAQIVETEMIDCCIVDDNVNYYCIKNSNFNDLFFNQKIIQYYGGEIAKFIFIDKIEDYPHLEYLL